MRLLYMLTLGTILLLARSSTAQTIEFTTEPSNLKKMEWVLIVDPKKQIAPFQVVARRGHPEGKITKFMKRYATTDLRKNNVRNYLFYKNIKTDGIHNLNHFILRMKNAQLGKMTANQKMAYWLNLRNVLIIQALAIDSKSVTSIKKIRGTPTNPGEWWRKKHIIINEEHLSIDDIEKLKILNNTKNPNIGYALYQGCVGGPTMPASGFTANNIDAQLDIAASHFINSNHAMRFRKNGVVLSPIFIWYAEHFFTKDRKALTDHIQRYANTKTAKKMAQYEDISFLIGELNYKLDSKRLSHKYETLTISNGQRPINPELVNAARRRTDQ